MSVKKGELQLACRMILQAIGEDQQRDGLQDTPKRFANWWSEFIDYDPGKVNTAFEHTTTDQMVVVSGMRVWSLCEHHLLPFWCDISIGYIATDRVLGLSKFARLAHLYAHRLQIQERMVHEIADHIQEITEAENVAVLGQGLHLCMLMRGIQTRGLMTTSVLRGVFREDMDVRQEFMSLVRDARDVTD